MVDDSSLGEASCQLLPQSAQAMYVSLYLRHPEKGSLPAGVDSKEMRAEAKAPCSGDEDLVRGRGYRNLR
jgi:hypothetical protein